MVNTSNTNVYKLFYFQKILELIDLIFLSFLFKISSFDDCFLFIKSKTFSKISLRKILESIVDSFIVVRY
jgi:hypothetical protein